MFVTLQCGEENVKLEYRAETLISMQHTGGKILGRDRKLTLEELLNGLADFEFMLWAFWQGMLIHSPTATKEGAYRLYDAFMTAGELSSGDDGGKLMKFSMAIGEAMNAALGIDLKKDLAKKKAKKEEEKMTPDSITTGTPPGSSATEDWA